MQECDIKYFIDNAINIMQQLKTRLGQSGAYITTCHGYELNYCPDNLILETLEQLKQDIRSGECVSHPVNIEALMAEIRRRRRICIKIIEVKDE